MIFVDTNVLIDLIQNDPIWAGWSQQQLDIAGLRDVVAINDIVYAELSVHYAQIEELDKMIADARLTAAPMPREALFLAGKAFQQYRRSGGTRTGVLADFFLGAHAAVTYSPLITRDPRRYRTHFPGIELVTPDIH
ncbi:MAG TPA: type II toxin-antitoxin system VapC family toxin [Stellaceae bacterium]|jgi:hypothetical protein|nr:type II toxin-antitoxin system VapC family toxin [Stellaceae bacterium]